MRIAPKAPVVKQDVGRSRELCRACFTTAFQDNGEQKHAFPLAEAGAVHAGYPRDSSPTGTPNRAIQFNSSRCSLDMAAAAVARRRSY